MNHFDEFNKARFFEYYVRILALKIGDNLIWYGTLCSIPKNHIEKLKDDLQKICFPNGVPLCTLKNSYNNKFYARQVFKSAEKQ